MEQYFFVSDKGPDDWPTLHRVWKMGESVYKFRGHIYGLDAIYFKRETIACVENPSGEGPFFIIPVEFLVDKDGNSPRGEYLVS